MALFVTGLARSKNHLTFQPNDSDVPSTHEWAQRLFVTQARGAPYDDLVHTCLKDPSLKTCAAVLVERWAFENGVDPEMFGSLMGELQKATGYDTAAFVARCQEQGYIDLTELPQDVLRELVANAPTWEEQKRKRKRKREFVESSV